MSNQLDIDFTTMNAEQRKDPLGNLLDIVGHETLHDIRKELFYWMEDVATNSDRHSECIEDRKEKFLYFGLILKCVERMYCIYNMIEAHELEYTYNFKPPKHANTK